LPKSSYSGMNGTKHCYLMTTPTGMVSCHQKSRRTEIFARTTIYRANYNNTTTLANSLKRIQQQEATTNDNKSNSSSSVSRNQRPVFHLFSSLTTEVKVYVISFVADAPFEPYHGGQKRRKRSQFLLQTRAAHISSSTSRSSLTHRLPYVYKEFYSLCTMDVYWRAAIVRMITRHEPQPWTEAVGRIVNRHDLLVYDDVTLDSTNNADSASAIAGSPISNGRTTVAELSYPPSDSGPLSKFSPKRCHCYIVPTDNKRLYHHQN
jgi:hypothetical protein